MRLLASRDYRLLIRNSVAVVVAQPATLSDKERLILKELRETLASVFLFLSPQSFTFRVPSYAHPIPYILLSSA